VFSRRKPHTAAEVDIDWGAFALGVTPMEVRSIYADLFESLATVIIVRYSEISSIIQNMAT
jgi:hypothetical protein